MDNVKEDNINIKQRFVKDVNDIKNNLLKTRRNVIGILISCPLATCMKGEFTSFGAQ